MSMNFNGSFSPNVFPIVVGASAPTQAAVDYGELQTMEKFTITFPVGATSNLTGTEVQVFPGEAVRVQVPDSKKSGLYAVWAKVRKGTVSPDSNDFLCICLKPNTDDSDWTAWGSCASTRFISIGKLIDTAGSLDTSPAPAQSSWTDFSADAASPWYQVAQIEPSVANFKYGGACYGPDAVATSSSIRDTNDTTDTTFRTTSAAPVVSEVVIAFDPTQAPAANSYFVVESLSFHSRPEVYNG